MLAEVIDPEKLVCSFASVEIVINCKVRCEVTLREAILKVSTTITTAIP